MESWIAVLTFLIVFLLLMLYIIVITDKNSFVYRLIVSLFFIFIIICSIVQSINVIKTSVKPIDVYRNKTELKITSVNGEPVDTVVIYKIQQSQNGI